MTGGYQPKHTDGEPNPPPKDPNGYSDTRIEKAIEFIVMYGGIDGAHHKDWCLDQVLRILAGDEYDRIVAEACDGEDGPNTYEWDTGIAP